MALSPSSLASGYPGRPNNPIAPIFACPCGSPATKLFYNPRGESVSINSGSLCLYLCDACDFRWTVMRAAGRVEEFVTDYEEKQRVKAEEAARRQHAFQEAQMEHFYKARAQAQLQNAAKQQNWQGMQNAYSPSGQSVCPENVQTPEKAWYDKYYNDICGIFGRKNG